MIDSCIDGKIETEPSIQIDEAVIFYCLKQTALFHMILKICNFVEQKRRRSKFVFFFF